MTGNPRFLETPLTSRHIGFRELNGENRTTKPNPGDESEASAKARNTREVVAVRYAAAERRQIQRAAELQQVPFSSYVREVSVRAAFDDLSARERPSRERKSDSAGVSRERSEKTGAFAVLEAEAQPVHYVDGEPVPSSWSSRNEAV
jgi:hypothetical protein